MRVVAYVRVSTDAQAEHGYGLDVQRQAIRSWAKAQGHKVALWASDEGVSGSNGLDARVGLGEALEALRAGKAKGLVVARLDRLARDLVLQETLIADIRRMGADVMSASPAEGDFLRDDPSDPSRKLIRQVLGAVAEYERSIIALRLRAGRAAKAAKGGFAYGSPPLGYRAENRDLVPDPEEQATLRRVEELRAEGLSLRQMAEVLTEEGYKTKRGGSWHPQTLARLVQREAS